MTTEIILKYQHNIIILCIIIICISEGIQLITYNTLQIIFNGYYSRGRIWANNILNPSIKSGINSIKERHRIYR